MEQKKYQEAVIYLKKAAKELPKRARIHYNLGLLLQFLKNNFEAEKALLNALLFAIADHFIKTGDYDKAQMVAKKMIELYPDNKVGHDILRFIKGASTKQ